MPAPPPPTFRVEELLVAAASPTRLGGADVRVDERSGEDAEVCEGIGAEAGSGVGRGGQTDIDGAVHGDSDARPDLVPCASAVGGIVGGEDIAVSHQLERDGSVGQIGGGIGSHGNDGSAGGAPVFEDRGALSGRTAAVRLHLNEGVGGVVASAVANH